ncbi:MAG: Calx-beta domain-containing protein, partial [Verrucomicrobiota bacterium]
MKQPWTSTLSGLAAVFICGSFLPGFEARAEPTVTLAVDNAAIAEAAGVATFTATLSETSLLDVTVNLGLSGTATGGGTDYTLSSSAIVISAGNLSNTATVTAEQDALDEDNETVIVDIDSVNNGTESGTQQESTAITDDDAEPSVTLAVDNATIAEAAGVATFTATLGAVSGRDVTVNLALSGTATGGGTDYTLSSAAIVISAGNLSNTATVTADQDVLDEDDETVIVDIDSIANGTESGTQQETTTILDDDALPTVTLSVDDTTIEEASGVAIFTATLNAVSGRDVTINLGFTGTASGGGTDYNVSSSTIVISAGNLNGTTTVTADQDAL